MGYILLRDKKLTKALNLFELATYLYPESVNTYDSYGEALVDAGLREKAIIIYSIGYDLAIKTGDKNLIFIEANLKNLQENDSTRQQMSLPPPPPPGKQ